MTVYTLGKDTTIPYVLIYFSISIKELLTYAARATSAKNLQTGPLSMHSCPTLQGLQGTCPSLILSFPVPQFKRYQGTECRASLHFTPVFKYTVGSLTYRKCWEGDFTAHSFCSTISEVLKYFFNNHSSFCQFVGSLLCLVVRNMELCD